MRRQERRAVLARRPARWSARGHTDQAAASAARALGAQAFTIGRHVAFAGAPTLRTAAHEAVHVVQQAPGVNLRGELSPAEAPHEREAEELAELVERGVSVEARLDRRAGAPTDTALRLEAGPSKGSPEIDVAGLLSLLRGGEADAGRELARVLAILDGWTTPQRRALVRELHALADPDAAQALTTLLLASAGEATARRATAADLRAEAFSLVPTLAQDPRLAEPPPAEPSLQELRVELAALVKETHARHLAEIAAALDGVTVTDGDVDQVLRILQTVEGPVIGALMRAIPAKLFGYYVDNLNSPHPKRFRREVLESLWVASPKMLRELDTDVIVDMDVRKLEVREHQALVYVLRNVGADKLRTIVDSKNGKQVEPLLTGGLPLYSEADQRRDLTRALTAERGDKQQGAADQERLAAIGTTLEERVKVLGDLIVTDAEATRVFDWIASFYPDEATLSALARKLEAQGRLDRLLDELPEAVAHDRSNPTLVVDPRVGPQVVHRAAAWLTLLRFRPPEKNLAQAEKLLSRGLFDWAVRDAEARLAYHLIKALPLRLQARFRELDHGEWFLRLERELATEVITSGEYQGVEVATKVVDGEEVLVDTAAALAGQYRKRQVAALLERVNAGVEAGLSEAQAREFVQELADIEDEREAQAVIRRLDSLGHLETLLRRVGPAYLFADEQERDARGRARPRMRRESTLRVLRGRDTIHVLGQARALLRWPVSKAEAYLAYHLVRALPEAERQEFLEADEGEWWTKIKKNLSIDQIEATGTNPYTGGEGGADRTQIRLQLADDRSWEPERIDLLDGLLRIGKAAGEGPWIFDESRRRPPRGEAMLQLYRRHRLFIEGEITAYQPEQIQDTGRGFSLGGLLSFLLFGGYQDLDLDDAGGIVGLDLVKLQGALGKVGGITFKSAAEVEAERALQVGIEARSAVGGKVNVVDARWDLAKGSVAADAPDLHFRRADILLGGLKVSTGDGLLQGVSLFAHYPTPGDSSAPFVRLDLGRLVISELLLVEASAIQAVKEVEAGPVGAQLSRPGATLAGQKELEPASESGFTAILIALAAAAPEAAAILLLQRIIYVVLQGLRLSDQVGEVVAGLERRATPLGVQLDVGGVAVRGVASSQGQSIRRLSVSGLSVRGGQSKSAAVEATIAYLTRRAAQHEQAGRPEKAAELVRQRSALEASLPEVRLKEAELARLQDHYRVAPATFTDADQARLELLQRELKSPGGGTLAIGEIKFEGLEGSISGELTLTDLFGYGEGQALGHALTTLDEFIRRGPEATPSDAQALAAQGLSTREGPDKRRSERGKAAALAAANAGFVGDLWLGDVSLSNFKIAGSVPRPEELQERVTAIKEKDELWFADPAKVASLRDIEEQIAEVKEYQALAARLIVLGPEERRRLDVLVKKFRARSTFEAKRLELSGVSLGVRASTGADGVAEGTASLRFEAIAGERVRVAGQEVRRLFGSGVEVSADFKGGLLGILDPRQALRGGGLAADYLEVDAGQRRLIARDLAVQVDLGRTGAAPDGKGDATLRVRARELTTEGVDLKTAIGFMKAEYEALSKLKKRLPQEERRRGQLERRLEEYKGLEAAASAASASYAEARGKAGEAAAEEAWRAAQDALDRWAQGLGRVTVEGLDVVLSGLGDVTREDFELQEVLRKGVTVRSGKTGVPIVRSVRASGEIVPGAGLAELGGLTGQIRYASDQIEFTELGIGDLFGQAITFTDGAIEARTAGRTGFAGLTVTGRVKFKESLDLERSLDEVQIDRLELQTLYAEQIDVRTPGFTLKLPAGDLGGIHVRDLRVKLPSGLVPNEAPRVTGHLGLDALNIKRLSTAAGKKFAAGGTFRGSGLSIDLLRADKRIVRLGDLNASSAKLLLPGSGIQIYFNAQHLNVDLEQDGDTIRARAGLADLTLASTNISTASLGLDAPKRAQMKGISAVVEAKTRKRRDGSLAVRGIVVKEFAIGSLKADELHVRLGEKDPRLGDSTVVDLPQGGLITDLRVSDLDLSAVTGSVDVGGIDVKDLHVAVVKQASKALELSHGVLRGKHLGATLHKGGGITVRLGDLEEVSGTLTAGGLTTDLSATGLRGEVTKQGDRIEVRGFGIGALKLNRLTLTDAAKGLRIDQPTTLSNLALEELVVVLAEGAPGPGGEATKVVKSISVRGLVVPLVEAPELSYWQELPAKAEADKPGQARPTRLAIGFKSAKLSGLRISTLSYERGGDAQIDASLDGLDVARLKVNADEQLTAADKEAKRVPTFVHLLTDAHVGQVTAKVSAKEFLKDGKLGELTGSARIGAFGLENVELDADGGIRFTADKIETQASAVFDPKQGIAVSVGATRVRNVRFVKGTDEVEVGEVTIPPTALRIDPNTNLEDITIPGPIRIGGKVAGGLALPAISYVDAESGLQVTVKEGQVYGVKVKLKANKFELLEIERVVVTAGTFELPDRPGQPEKEAEPYGHFASSFQVLSGAHGEVVAELDSSVFNTDVTIYKMTIQGGRITKKRVFHRDNFGEKEVEKKDYEKGALLGLTELENLAEVLQLVLFALKEREVAKQKEAKEKGVKEEPSKVTENLKYLAGLYLRSVRLDVHLKIDPGGRVPFKDLSGRTIGLVTLGGAKDIDNSLVLTGSPGKQLDVGLSSLVLEKIQWEASTLNLFLAKVKLIGTSLRVRIFPAFTVAGKIDSAELSGLQLGDKAVVPGPPQEAPKRAR